MLKWAQHQIPLESANAPHPPIVVVLNMPAEIAPAVADVVAGRVRAVELEQRDGVLEHLPRLEHHAELAVREWRLVRHEVRVWLVILGADDDAVELGLRPALSGIRGEVHQASPQPVS